jgi:hypothetical protein
MLYLFLKNTLKNKFYVNNNKYIKIYNMINNIDQFYISI